METISKEGINQPADRVGLEFWSRTLDKKLDMTGFPHDYTGQELKTNKVLNTRLFSGEVQTGLFEMTRHSHLGVFMILVSGVKYLLSRYTGLRDIVVGTPALKMKESEPAGSSWVLLRSKLIPDMTIRDWINGMKETMTEAFRHQDVSFHAIAQRAGIVYSDDTRPQIKTLVLFNPIQSRESIDEIHSEIIFDFDMIEGVLSLTIKYSPQLFSAATIEHLTDALFLYYACILKDTQTILEDIKLLSESNRHQLLYQFNKPQELQSGTACTFQQLFNEQVRAQPEKTALIFEHQEWTYQKLNDQADRLAFDLVKNHQLLPEEAVAVYMNRSPYVYIAMLAIWKASGVFVPIDPAVPLERVTDILREGNVRIALTTAANKQALRGIKPKCELLERVFCVDTDDLSVMAVEPLLMISSGGSLAYIIFTSGSTGKPKGVEIEHNSVVRFLHAIDEVIAPVSPQVILNAASIAFDLFISEALYGLFKGIQVVIANEREHIDSAELGRLVEEHHIDVMMITPSRLQLMMLHKESAKALQRIKMFLIGGQELKIGFLREIQQMTKAYIVNVYGPTEATCLATSAVLNQASQVTIGRPLDHYRCYIVDEKNRLQLIGAIGELVIAGTGVARGYVNNPRLTEEKFIEDLLYEGQRMYKTGDLARWLPNGEIQYLGRIDSQVKIRGYRIETSDVETALISHPDIREAVVLVNPGPNGVGELVAYLISDHKLSFNVLYDFLKLKVPEYMVPVRYAQVSALPLTVNGKIDKSALASMDQLKLSGATLYRAPMNNIQRALVEVWQQLLEVERIGIDDNFFQIGGTSLSGVKMVALLSDRYTISINDLFDYPTIAQLSLHVVEHAGYFHHLLEVMKPSAVHTDVDMVASLGSREEALRTYLAKVEAWRDRDLTLQKSYKHILLTGGTGFLGTHLLQELLNRSNARITLLVRGESRIISEDYLQERFQYYFLEGHHEVGWARVSVVCGDVTLSNLGLESTEYEKLAEDVDCIIHTASLTRHYGTAAEFEKVNIDGTRHILHFAAFKNIKDIHFTSNMSIGTGSNIQLFDEYIEEVGPIRADINNHFLRSKMEAEALLRTARDRGLSCTIYRLNSLNNNTQTGKFMVNKESNAFYSFVNAMNNIGLFPDLHEPILDMTGVDQAAKAIVTLFDRPALHNQNHHVFNPHRISWGQLGRELQSINEKIELVDYELFIRIITQKFNDPSTRKEVINVILNLFLLRNTEWLNYLRVCDRTELILDRLGFKWGTIGKQQTECYLS
ncbi:non-ribosomal peptide synthetase family protein [Paenibacillus sp. FSL L8-0689]|uniref:non-ribosomal peptide synthetase family protein n=1 Tax=Paenibacillus sp. FSL L8-0689 TaxID=2921607 RepID=UPI0030F52AF1